MDELYTDVEADAEAHPSRLDREYVQQTAREDPACRVHPDAQGYDGNECRRPDGVEAAFESV